MRRRLLFHFVSVSVSIPIIRHASLFRSQLFRQYVGSVVFTNFIRVLFLMYLFFDEIILLAEVPIRVVSGFPQLSKLVIVHLKDF